MDAVNWPQLHRGADAIMTPCPKCGNYDYRVSRQCPQYGGEPVCIRCCYECIYYDPKSMGPKCRWYLSHPQTDWAAEIIKVQQQIIHTENRVRRLYELNWPKKAAALEIDLKNLYAEKRKLEAKRDEGI